MNDKTEITKEAVEADMSFNAPVKTVTEYASDLPPDTEVVIEHDMQPAGVVNLPAKAADINAMSPMQQFQQAKAMGMSLEEMKGMLEVQKDWEANEARKAFHAALSEWKKNPPKILKDLINLKYGSAYSSIGNTVNTCNESMGPFGLNARWDYPDSGDINILIVTCILSHALGHEEKVTLKGLPDKEGSKNPAQERKAGRTYLKLETYEAVTGVASIAGNVDDDGNSAGPVIECITKEQALIISAKITDNDLNNELFTGWVSKFFPYTQGDADKLSVEHYKKVIAKLDETIAHKNQKGDE